MAVCKISLNNCSNVNNSRQKMWIHSFSVARSINFHILARPRGLLIVDKQKLTFLFKVMTNNQLFSFTLWQQTINTPLGRRSLVGFFIMNKCRGAKGSGFKTLKNFQRGIFVFNPALALMCGCLDGNACKSNKPMITSPFVK